LKNEDRVTGGAPGAVAGASQRGRRTDFATVVIHWIVVILFVASFVTGIRIAADAPDATVSQALAVYVFQGEVIVWHLWSAWALAGIAVAYVVFMLVARLGARIVLDGSRVRALTTGDRRTRWQSINVLVYWLAFVLLAVAIATGTIIYLDLGAQSQLLLLVHRVAAWSLVVYVAVHVVAQWMMTGARGLLKIMTPRLAFAVPALLALGAAIATAALVFQGDTLAVRSLQVARTSSPPRLDGMTGDATWRAAQPVVIQTMRGQNLPNESVAVTVRAAQDGERAYFLFEWPDTTRSQKHLPLEKTESGWRVIQTDFARSDEDTYYEDKFAVMLSNSSRFGALESTHLGPRPLSDKPGPAGGRGLHYTEDGSLLDVWHWKSVRTGPLGQIDDNFFGPPLAPPEKTGARYTAGYSKDPKTDGGFTMNWERFDPEGVVPRWLPKDPAVLARMGEIDLDPAAVDRGDWWIPEDLLVPYSAEHDARIPVGTVMPSVVISQPFQGDRGDVAAVAHWDKGHWRLEVARKLDTGSSYDVPIQDGTFLWVAVFDHTQTRHSLHLHPARLVFE